MTNRVDYRQLIRPFKNTYICMYICLVDLVKKDHCSNEFLKFNSGIFWASRDIFPPGHEGLAESRVYVIMVFYTKRQNMT